MLLFLLLPHATESNKFPPHKETFFSFLSTLKPYFSLSAYAPIRSKDWMSTPLATTDINAQKAGSPDRVAGKLDPTENIISDSSVSGPDQKKRKMTAVAAIIKDTKHSAVASTTTNRLNGTVGGDKKNDDMIGADEKKYNTNDGEEKKDDTIDDNAKKRNVAMGCDSEKKVNDEELIAYRDFYSMAAIHPRECKYKTLEDGRRQIVGHSTHRGCVLCDRYKELSKQLKIRRDPNALIKYGDEASYIHSDDGAFDFCITPLWLTGENFLTCPSGSSFYKSLDQCLKDDFRSSESLPSFPVENRKDYVISYSLYVDDLEDFPYYWLGLKMNIDAVKQWFRGWTIHLFVEKSLRSGRATFFQTIIAYAVASGVTLKVIPCREGAHPMLERYQPLMSPFFTKGVCIVRDVDSILSLTDAKIIDAWLQDPGRDVLTYLEHKMPKSWSCGGGIAIKMDKKLSYTNVFATVLGATRGRDYDEKRLAKWLQEVTNVDRWAVVQVRMTEHGTYCLDYYHGSPKVLWGKTSSVWREFYRDRRLSGTIRTVDDCEKACLKLVETTCSEKYVHSHTQANRESILRCED